MLWIRPLFFLLAGCTGDSPSAPSDTTPADSGSPDSGEAPVAEECDGEDNDRDGEVDEGWPDEDGDGIADCLQCEVAASGGADVGEADACAEMLVPAADPWDIEMVWAEASPDFEDYEWGCWLNSIVDLDGDGHGEILCQKEELLVFSSASREQIWSTERFVSLSPTSIGDVDGDGEIEIVGFDESGYVVCLDAQGDVEWVSWTPILQSSGRYDGGWSLLETIDIDGDGALEIITHASIISGLDGSLISTFSLLKDGKKGSFRPFAFGPILQDGNFQLAFRGGLYAADGEKLWSRDSLDDDTGDAVSPLLVQADMDDAAEILWLQRSKQILTDTDGTILNEVDYSLDLYSGGAGCSGDIDGDGMMEVVTAGSTDSYGDEGIIQAHDLSGELLWDVALSSENSIFFASCSTFDFDLDGAQEVLIVTGDFFYILSGLDGAALYSYTHEARPALDVPMVVDLDGDGSVEIVVPNMIGHNGLWDPEPKLDVGFRVFAHADAAWPPGGRIWPHSNWSGVGIRQDGSADPDAEGVWLSTGLYRGQPTLVAEGADLRAEVVDSCTSESVAGEVGVSVRWVNGGPWEAEAGTPMAVYALNDDGGREALLDVVNLSEKLPAGYASDSIEMAFSREDIGVGIEVVAGDDGTSTIDERDCNPTNNAATFTP